MNTSREWEKEFERRFGNANDPQTARYLCLYNEHLGFTSYHEDVKSFICTIEDKAREEEREKANISDFSAGFTFGRSVEREMVRELVEGMKERTRHFPMKSNGGNWDEWNDGYDKALSDIITALNEKEV